MAAILFLTYYYPPCNATGANRPKSFTKNLILHGHDVTVITRHWTGKEKTWDDQLGELIKPIEIVNEHNLEIHFLPYKKYRYFKNFGFINTFFENIKGDFNYELEFEQFENYINEIIRKKQFNYILVSSPPLTVLKVGASMSKKYNIPLIVDIRDFENDIILYKKKNYGWLRWQQHKILLMYFKNWIENASIIFTTSPPITDYITKISCKKAFTLNNGFNSELLSINEKNYLDKLHITVTGSLWEMANLPVMVETCKLLYVRHPDIQIQFNFIGLLINNNVSEMFRKVIPNDRLNITHRTLQDEAMKIASSSHILMLAGFDEMKGAYTTKIFEYLGLRRNILQIPGDGDVVEELIHKTRSGKTPHTAEEAYNNILEWYKEWKEKGTLMYNGDIVEIKKWSREKQFEKLLERLENAEV